MKKTSVIFLLTLLGMVGFFMSCDSDDEKSASTVSLVLERSEIALRHGASAIVRIESGNGDYKVAVSNNKVAEATVNANEITIQSITTEELAEAVLFVEDKAGERASVKIRIAKEFDLQLDKTQIKLKNGVIGADTTVVRINSGNFGYKVDMLDNAADFINIDTIGMGKYGRFTVRAVASGVAKIKVADSLGKEVTVTIEVDNPAEITLSKSTIHLDAVQGKENIEILSGGGEYEAIVDNPRIINISITTNVISITGKTNGKTRFVIKDKDGQVSSPVEVEVNGGEYAMNLGTEYFCYADFRELAAVDASVRSCKQVTFEILCKMKGYRGLQTFMGLEGKLIMRGANDDYKPTHPIQIAGLGDRIMMLSSTSFNLNEWMHLALVVDCSQSDVAQKYKLYINGVQDVLNFTRTDETHSAIDLVSSNDGDRFEIGRASGQDWRAMNGIVSEARVWNVARSAEQIRENMCTLSGDRSGLLTRWNFTAGCATDYIQDSNGGKYQTNLIISKVSPGSNYSQAVAPQTVFVEKGCPN